VVRLMLPGKSDVLISQLASRRLYQGFLRAGVEIYEYQPQVLHAKMVVVDKTVYLGSANLDARSLGINYELLVRLRDPALAGEAREVFQADLNLCRRIHLLEWPRSRGLVQKLLESLSFFVLARLDPFLARWQWRRWRLKWRLKQIRHPSAQAGGSPDATPQSPPRRRTDATS
jgi:cardiolipin synthase A/B